MSVVIATAVVNVVEALLRKLPDIIRELKGKGKRRKEDAVILEILCAIQKQQADQIEGMHEMLCVMMKQQAEMNETIEVLLQRLEDNTSRNSEEDLRTREEVGFKLTKNLMADAGISPEDQSSVEEGANLTEVTKQPERWDKDGKGCLVDSEMSSDEQLAPTRHISSQEAEKVKLLHGFEEDRKGQDASAEEEIEGKFLTKNQPSDAIERRTLSRTKVLVTLLRTKLRSKTKTGKKGEHSVSVYFHREPRDGVADRVEFCS